jgi:hypothetical protein
MIDLPRFQALLEKVREAIERNAERADAAFAEQHGALAVPERQRGALTDETA